MRLFKPFAAQDEAAVFRKLIGKQLLPIAVLLLIGWLVWTKAETLDFASIYVAIHAITAQQWCLALIGTCLSFWTMGRMDVLVHRLMDTNVPDHAAQISGMASVATAQLVGFGLLTGTLARWRILSNVSLWKAAQITTTVSLTFMFALAGLTALMVLIAPPDIPGSRTIAFVSLTAILALVAATVWKPRRLIRFHLPPLKAQFAMFGLVLLDSAASALTLYVLFPGVVPPPTFFFTVFLLALGVGLLGTTPGGVGPFEVMMLACFTQIPDAEILAAIMGYRIVYFAMPATLAIGVLLFGPALSRNRERRRTARVQNSVTHPNRPIAASALSYNALRAESGLVRQGEWEFLINEDDQIVSLVAATGQSLIMLADPLAQSHSVKETLRTLKSASQDRLLTPCLYKCNARTAVAARQARWTLLQMSHEAVVRPKDYNITKPGYRQLRRFLRKSAASGVTISEADANIPFAEMRAIADAWSKARKGARGFSMGRFEEAYVSAQRVYLAHLNGVLIGFVTLHESWNERTLDLMCCAEDAPAGTTHALIDAAISAARVDNLPRVSLAAVPHIPKQLRLSENIRSKISHTTGAKGLMQFKSSFNPTWEPLYLAAPNRIGLCLAAIDLADRITRPRSNIESTS